jgi:hypothetical protein
MSASAPTRFIKALFMLWCLVASVLAQQTATPRFEDYPVTEMFTGKPAEPILSSPEIRRYRTRIRNGVSTAADVWNGSWRNPIKKEGPNFAGHYFVIRWGCGSECVMMAIVDAKTGIVYDPPLSGVGSELFVPLDNLSDMEVDFQPDSSLLVLRNACRDFSKRNSCGVFYFNWKDNHFDPLKFIRREPER